MSALHDNFHLHMIAVFPSDPAFLEMQACYQEVERTVDWLTVTTEYRLDRSVVDCEDNFVIFFGALPSWLPMKTEAIIGLFFLGYTVLDPRDNERAWKFYGEWRKTSIRADIIFVRNQEQQGSISRFSRNTIHIANGFYNSKVMGLPKFQEDSPFNSAYLNVPQKKYWVASYGEPSGRRGPIIEKLKKQMPQGTYIHVPSVTPNERKKLLSESRILLHIRASNDDESYDPFVASEAIASTAMLVIEHGSRWPFDDDGDQCFRISMLEEYSKDCIERLVYLAGKPMDCIKTARRAHMKFSVSLSASRVCEQLLSYAKSSVD